MLPRTIPRLAITRTSQFASIIKPRTLFPSILQIQTRNWKISNLSSQRMFHVSQKWLQSETETKKSETLSDTTEAGHGGTMTRLAREYGRVAFVVYGALTFLVFCSCYLSIVYLGVDVHALLERFHGLREKFGFGAPSDAENAQIEEVKKEKDEAKTRQFFSWQTWLLALAMTKIFVPFKLAITGMITPSVARVLRARGWEVGTKKFSDVRPK